MKELTLFYFEGCPHCKNAIRWQEELLESHPEYREVPLRLVDERKEPQLAGSFDYWLVPTYYLGGMKLCEGFTQKRYVEDAFRRAYES
jgi:glutaredoxin